MLIWDSFFNQSPAIIGWYCAWDLTVQSGPADQRYLQTQCMYLMGENWTINLCVLLTTGEAQKQIGKHIVLCSQPG